MLQCACFYVMDMHAGGLLSNVIGSLEKIGEDVLLYAWILSSVATMETGEGTRLKVLLYKCSMQA